MKSQHPNASDARGSGKLARDDRPSKSQLKRDMTALQKLGVQLLELPAAQLQQLALPENLRDAIELAKKITSHEGRRRQLQLIGKLMRSFDTEPIAMTLAQLEGQHRALALRHHAIEHWRDQMLARDGASAELYARHPQIETGVREQLERLIIQARAEQSSRRPPRAAREMFRLLRDIIDPGLKST